MKTFNKIALVSAIAAAPFTQAMEALDDSVLGNTTGQAGVTVEISIADQGITIGEVLYTDTATVDGSDNSINDIDTDFDGAADLKSGGQVSIQDIKISNITKLTQTIDVDDAGDLVMGVSELTGMKVAVGQTNTFNDDGSLKLGSSAVALRDASGANETELVNNLDVTLDLGASTTYIRNLNGRDAAALTALGVPVAAQNGSVAIQAKAAVRITDMNIGAFGYTGAQAVVQTTKLGGAVTATAAQFTDIVDGATAAQQATAANTDGVAKAQYLIGQYNEGKAVADQVSATVVAGTALTDDQKKAIGSEVANSAAVNVTGVQFYQDTTKNADGTANADGKAKDFATIDQTIWAKGGSAEIGGGVYIQIGKIAGTLEVGAIEIGGASIGSVQVSNINLAGMTQRIYGH